MLRILKPQNATTSIDPTSRKML